MKIFKNEDMTMDKSFSGPRKILRAPALRRGREIIPISSRVKLEKVLGLTVSNNAAFDCDTNASIVAYPAGCVVVIYNLRKNKQGHILSSSKKTITSLSFSSDGKYLATGECGHQPHVRVWDVQEKVQVAEFQGHKYGINCVAFSPNLKYVVSVGSQHDMIVNVWDWRSNVKVASNKVSCKVKALSFASNGNYFVTVGNRHVKFWYLECSRSTRYKHEAVPLMGRSAILGDQRNNYFCDVACGKGNMWESTYAITKSGLLCEFNSRRLLDKWVELRTTSANSISVGDNLIIIGCSEGVIRCFNPYNLNYIATLPRPHPLGVDVAKNLTSCKSSNQSNTRYPDTIAIALDEISNKVTCVYNDHSLYVWDIKDIKKVGKSHSYMYHSACIWGVEVYPELHESLKNILPKGTFLTCSSDDTIRFWNLETALEQDTQYHRNIYSNELLKVLYVDSELSYLCDTELNSSGSNDKVDTTYDGKNGVRCLRISPDGKSLASGDRSGNIRIHNLEYVEEVCKIEAHDSEVLCLEYSKPAIVNGQETRYLASASRDRLIHVFDVKQDYTFQQTLDDHSSSITAVRFVQSGDALQMISCGADKSIIFRKAIYNPQLSLLREHHVVGKTTLYDMEVDAQQSHILTACQDRNIRVYSVSNGKHVRCFRGSQGEDGTLIKVVLDSSGTYLATSCTDKSLYLYDYITGECLATMFGHSELVTGLKFTNDGRHLISVSGDGCIFVWKLPIDVTKNMISKQVLIEGSGLPALWQNGKKSDVSAAKPLEVIETNGESKKENSELEVEMDIPTPPGYRFSIGQLPLWAKKQVLEKLPENVNSEQNLPPPIPPRGRWAQRIDGQGLVVRSYLDSDAVIPFPNMSEENGETKNETNGSIENGYNSQADDDFQISLESKNEILNGTANEDMNDTLSRQTGSNIILRHPLGNNRHSNNRNMKMYPLSNSGRADDVDAEDERSDSEISEMVYYPASEDGSDIAESVTFQVCANNESSKENVPHLRKPRIEHLNDTPVLNTPEHETNSDEEEGSTPVDSDRSFLSSLCISTENLERLGQREKFMKSNYESLEKGDSVESHEVDKNFYRQSISAKFLAGSLLPTRRLLLNGSTKTPERQMSTTTKKREELLKAISDTKKKLETVGFRSGLSSSKSIADLHSTPDREMFKTPKHSTPGDIRRAASMVDLSNSLKKGPLFSRPSSENSDNHSTAPLWSQSKMSQSSNSPPQSPTADSSKSPEEITVTKATPSHSEVSRSSSSSSLYSKKQNASGTLYKASSVYSLPDRTRPASNMSFSSRNSSSSPAGRSSLQPLSLRNQSPSKLSNQEVLLSDSSSDSSPIESTPMRNGRAGPSNMRTRYFSLTDSINPLDSKSTHAESSSTEGLQKLRLKSRSEWDLKSNPAAGDSLKSNGDSWQSSRYLSYSPRRNYIRPLKPNLSKVSSAYSLSANSDKKNLNQTEDCSLFSYDPASVPLTPDVCESIADNLARVSAFAMQVFQRLSLTDLPSEQKSVMTNALADGVWQAQQNLRPAYSMLNPWNMDNAYDPSRRLPSMNHLYHPNGGEPSSMPRFQQPSLSQPDTTALLEQFSEKLLNMLEQKISNSQDKPNK